MLLQPPNEVTEKTSVPNGLGAPQGGLRLGAYTEQQDPRIPGGNAGQPGILKIVDPEVMIGNEGFTQRSGTA